MSRGKASTLIDADHPALAAKLKAEQALQLENAAISRARSIHEAKSFFSSLFGVSVEDVVVDFDAAGAVIGISRRT